MMKGTDRVTRSIARIKKAATNAALNAVAQNADELAVAVKAAAPRGRTGKLANSVKVTFFRDKDGRRTHAVTAGDEEAFYARFVEFGTAPSTTERKHPGASPQPFFFPTVRAYKRRGVSRVSRNINKAVKQAARQ